MKKTRFAAACSGLMEKAKGAIRRNMVENALRSNELEADAQLYSLDDQKQVIIKEIATGNSSELKANLQKLADLIQQEETLKATKKMSSRILEILDEEIEVEDEDKK